MAPRGRGRVGHSITGEPGSTAFAQPAGAILAPRAAPAPCCPHTKGDPSAGPPFDHMRCGANYSAVFSAAGSAASSTSTAAGSVSTTSALASSLAALTSY